MAIYGPGRATTECAPEVAAVRQQSAPSQSSLSRAKVRRARCSALDEGLVFGPVGNYIFSIVEDMEATAVPDMGIDKLEEMVMLALVRLGSNAYGVSIQQEISDRAGRDVSFATIYKVLDRLEQKGFVSSRLGESTPERVARGEHIARVTCSGCHSPVSG